MRNCLVTKLKSVIDNSSMHKLSTMVYHVDGTQSSDSVLSVNMGGASKAKIVNNTDSVYFTNNSGSENYGTELTSFPQNGIVYITRGTCDIEVSSKYELKNYSNYNSIQPDFGTMDYAGYSAENFTFQLSRADGKEFAWFKGGHRLAMKANSYLTGLNVLKNRLEDLNCLDNVVTVNFSSVGISGTLNLFLVFPNLEDLQLNQCVISGDFADLGALTSIKKMILTSSNINGSIEEFVLNQRDNGRVSSNGNIDTWYFSMSNITWRGVRNPLANISSISWTATTITIKPQGSPSDTRTYYKDSGGHIITD